VTTAGLTHIGALFTGVLAAPAWVDLRISRKYTAKEFPMRQNAEQRVVLVIEVERARFAKLPFTHAPA